MEEDLDEGQDENKTMTGPTDDFAFNPDISFPDANIGNQLENTSNCPTVDLVTRGRENPGVEPVQSGLLTDAFSITGESSPESDKKFTMEILCNLFFFLYRVNQYQGAKTSYLRQPLGNAKSFTMKTMAVRI